MFWVNGSGEDIILLSSNSVINSPRNWGNFMTEFIMQTDDVF